MDHEEHKKHFNNPAWVAYLHPYTFVIPDGEQPLKVELSEINSNTYNYGKLCRLTGSADIPNFPFKLLICYDGALAIPKAGIYAEKEKAVDFFNTTFCELMLGGFYCEGIDRKDIVNGQLYQQFAIWPVDLGNSATSNLNSKLRMRLGGTMDTITLSNPNSITISQFHNYRQKGHEILSQITNLTPKFLVKGITEIRYKNWDLVLSNLWITVEQLVDFIWHHQFLKNEVLHPAIKIDGRIDSLKDDNRTWSTSVKQEILFQAKIIDEDIIGKLHPARKARNKLVHEGRNVSKNIAIDLFETVQLLINKITGYDLRQLKLNPSVDWDSRGDTANFSDDYFDKWKNIEL